MDKKNQITREGYKNLEAELEFLRTVKRPEIIQRLEDARAQGDLSENSEYESARNDQALNEERIKQIEETLKNAQIVEIDANSDSVSIGSKVKFINVDTKKEFIYRLVGSAEADIERSTISIESPIGSAFLGKGKGDVVDVEAPKGIIKYQILDLIVE